MLPATTRAKIVCEKPMAAAIREHLPPNLLSISHFTRTEWVDQSGLPIGVAEEEFMWPTGN